jgi:hypothetical protein
MAYEYADQQTVAGGITAGMHPLETMIKECDEEANLPEDFVQARLKSVIFPVAAYPATARKLMVLVWDIRTSTVAILMKQKCGCGDILLYHGGRVSAAWYVALGIHCSQDTCAGA